MIDGSNTTEEYPFFKGGGTMGKITREHDWSKTLLGIPSAWPQSLQTSLSIVLNSIQPMVVLWGEENTCIFNDAYRSISSISSNAEAVMGKSAEALWGSDWDLIKPLIQQIKTYGEVIDEDRHFQEIYTLNGPDAAWSANYSPIYGENQAISGVLVSWFEKFSKNHQDTEIKSRTQYELDESEMHLQLLRDTVPAMIFYIDNEQRYLSYNQVFRSWFGVGPTDAIGKTVREFLGEAAYEKVGPRLDVAYSGVQERYELFAPSRMGVPRWLDIVYTPHKNTEGQVVGVIVHATDVTKSKQTEISLRQSEARFRALIEEAPVATCLFTGRELTIEIANELMLGVWGKDRSVIGQTLENGVPELKGQPFLDILDKVFTTGIEYSDTAAPAELEVNGILNTYYFNFTYKPLFNENGEVYGIMDMAVDVTEQVLIRKRVEENERKLRTLIQSAPPAIGMFVGRELIIESPNRPFSDTIGRGNDIEGKSLKALMPELEQQPFLDLLDNVFTTGEMFQADSAKLQVLKDGNLEEKYFNVTFSPLFDEEGNVYAIIDVSVDVTDYVIAKEGIEAKEKELRDLINAAPVGICVVSNAPVKIEEVNDRFLQILGIKGEQLIGKPDWMLFGDMAQIFERELDILLKSGVKHITEEQQIKILRNDAEESIFITFEYVPLLDSNSDISKVMIIAIEMTHQVQMRKEIEKAVTERTKELATSNISLQRSNNELEQFAYIASHDLQEPVRKINTFVGMLEDNLGTINGKSRIYIDKIKSSTGRMEILIRDVLALSIVSRNAGLLTSVDLQAVLREVENENELQISQKQAVIEYSDLPVIKAIPSQMLQLFSNLVSNALKYSHKHIRPVIKISSSKLKNADLKNYTQLSLQKKYYKIEVSDNGIGFDKQHAERIFKIFQRLHAKNEFEGTGIGLSICQKIVHNHGGEIMAASEPGAGAVFIIILPY